MAISTAATAWRKSRQVLRCGFCLAVGAALSTRHPVLYISGEYSASFRSRLDGSNRPPDDGAPAAKPLQLRSCCHCGKCDVAWDFEPQRLNVIRCYCTACRRFQASSFASYLATGSRECGLQRLTGIACPKKHLLKNVKQSSLLTRWKCPNAAWRLQCTGHCGQA